MPLQNITSFRIVGANPVCSPSLQNITSFRIVGANPVCSPSLSSMSFARASND
ncbi:MAG: hypothetical protein KAI83_01395 [Thiomargarita sp.]|nr:hypothetical protein [Thiomargarita sp.]